MHPIIQKTFGGLTKQYYSRQLFFGGGILILFVSIMLTSPEPIKISVLILMIINTLLYPYARFVYESIVNFIVGENTFYVNALFMLFVKYLTMGTCWAMAIFIAPIGLMYLYYHHTKVVNDK